MESPFIEKEVSEHSEPMDLDESLVGVDVPDKFYGLTISWALGIFLTTIVGLVLLWWFWPGSEQKKKKKVRFEEVKDDAVVEPVDLESEIIEPIVPPKETPPEKVSPYEKKPSNINKIMDGLFISDDYSARDYAKLKSLGITQILIVGQELAPHTDKDFVTGHIPIVDMENAQIQRWFASAISFIKNGPTLVHCSQGISRSATICAAYLIFNGASYTESMDKIKAARSIVQPNNGFVEQLKEFETTRKPVEGYEIKIKKGGE